MHITTRYLNNFLFHKKHSYHIYTLVNLSYTTITPAPFSLARKSPVSWFCQMPLAENTAHSVAVYTRLADVPAAWDALVPTHSRSLHRPLLQAIEDCPPTDSTPIYVLFFEQQRAIGVAYCQLIDFKASESISREPIGDNECFFTTLGKHLKEQVAKNIAFHGLVCGNLLLTGEHSHHFAAHITPQRSFELLNEGIESVRTTLENRLKIDIRVTLFKEFFEHSRAAAAPLRDSGCYEFTVQPNMIFELQPAWRTFDDYLEALTSKARTRAKRAFKKLDGLECRVLSLDDLTALQGEMHQLYRAIANTAEFNLIYLQEGYFAALKRALQDDFCVKGYFDTQNDHKLVGFMTAFRNGNELEAHFLGLDDAYNASHQLYLNILFELARLGIEWQSHRVVYARTALEIKSSVGATAHEMYNYLRHRNSLSNALIKSLIAYLQPKGAEWQPRHPFKDN
jgi:hypothetical protein